MTNIARMVLRKIHTKIDDFPESEKLLIEYFKDREYPFCVNCEYNPLRQSYETFSIMEEICPFMPVDGKCPILY
jgi:hypothetical protein